MNILVLKYTLFIKIIIIDHIVFKRTIKSSTGKVVVSPFWSASQLSLWVLNVGVLFLKLWNFRYKSRMCSNSNVCGTFILQKGVLNIAFKPNVFEMCKKKYWKLMFLHNDLMSHPLAILFSTRTIIMQSGLLGCLFLLSFWCWNFIFLTNI